MIAPPEFGSFQEFRARIGDVDFWHPYVSLVLERHNLADSGAELISGYNPTNPTFLYGDLAIKLFGYGDWWRGGYSGESAAHTLLATDTTILAPHLLASGRLYNHDGAPWPYLVTTRVPGSPWHEVNLPYDQQVSIARQLGEQVRRIHALSASGLATHEEWPAINVANAAARSSLAPHLVKQVDEYLTRMPPFDDVFVHGDLAGMHVFVEDCQLSGIIDWGDAMVTDRHYELIQIHRDMFNCDKDLLRDFLDASGWPVDKDFPQKAMGHALYRQAIMLTQHQSGDVFEPVAALFPLDEITTLDELATELFGV